jgi:hypothetical protein
MTDNRTLQQAQNICRNLLELDTSITIDKIIDAIDKVSQIIPSLTDDDKKILLKNLSATTGVSQDAPRILDDNKTVPWVLDKWAENPDQRKFWRRYRDYLADKKNFPSQVITRLDDLTNDILDRLADPHSHDQFDKRGLVVGHVQSGKTSNYIGLINKAADAGYKLIIVLAGIHNSLRSQTQLRIDEGFLGYDSEITRSFNQSSNRIGVGKIDRQVAAHSLTSSASNGDFRRTVAETVNLNLRGTDPVVVVIKKNNSVLKNLVEWLAGKEGEDYGDGERIIKDIPLILIDDEADNASINISKNSVSAINGSIRAILELFEKSAYVGYTATPYANIFMPTPQSDEEILRKGVRIAVGNQNYLVGEDLFPRNFIINIPPPSNYIGPEKIFGIVSEDTLYENDSENEDLFTPFNLYESINDYQPIDYFDSKIVSDDLRVSNDHYIPDKHKKDDTKPTELPESLKKAIQCFIISCAARRARGQVEVHNSMLIHVTRFVDWQNAIALLVGEELARYKKRIEFNQENFIGNLQRVWNDDYFSKTEEVIEHLKKINNEDPEIVPLTWDQVKVHLLPAVTKIRLRAVHGSKLLGGLEVDNLEPLDYYDHKKGFSVIAVGGNKLSRGLTLEGLTVSYYLRSSKMYDTLMQMGRWFGYRPGYLDMCRLFTSSELISHYKYITLATEEMRAEFDRMALLRETPNKYGLKVRSHPGVLSITASNKFRYRKMMKLSFSGALEETWEFDISKEGKESFEQNYDLTKSFVEHLGKPSIPLNNSDHLKSQNFVWNSENNYKSVINFLNRYKTRQQSFHTSLITQYIEKQAQTKNKNLANWTIAVVNNSRSSLVINLSDEVKVGLSYRKDDPKNQSGSYALVKSHIIGNFHEYIDLTDHQLNKALEETRHDREQEGKDPETTVHPNPLRIRKNRPDTNGLLLIYPLDPDPQGKGLSYSDVPIIGLAVSFPYIEKDDEVIYAVNDIFNQNQDRYDYDYPDEYDIEDLLDENSDDKISDSDIRQRNLDSKSFLGLIEKDEQDLKLTMKLDETEFQQGFTPDYSNSDDPTSEAEYRSNILVPSNTKTEVNIIELPYYDTDEIQRYTLKSNTKNKVLNPDAEYIFDREYVVGMMRSKYVVFSYHNKPALFSNSLWLIQVNRLNSKFLTAILNSTLFGAWVRVNGQQKKDTYFISSDVLKKFPIVNPLDEDIWMFESLYDLLSASRLSDGDSTGEIISSYYAKILDALIFCQYLNESLADQYRQLKSELEKSVQNEISLNDDLGMKSEQIYNTLYDKENPVRNVLYFLDTNPKVSKIKSVFTQ